jgi:hypothetical protein
VPDVVSIARDLEAAFGALRVGRPDPPWRSRARERRQRGAAMR